MALYETPSLQTPLIWTGPVEQEKPQYTEEELERYEKRGAKITDKGWLHDKGWLQSEDGRLIIPENAQWKILKGKHHSFYFSACNLVVHNFYFFLIQSWKIELF